MQNSVVSGVTMRFVVKSTFIIWSPVGAFSISVMRSPSGQTVHALNPLGTKWGLTDCANVSHRCLECANRLFLAAMNSIGQKRGTVLIGTHICQ